VVTDAELVQRTVNGDHEAFSVLVDRYARSVTAVIADIIGQQTDVEDVVQECFLRAYRFLGSYREEAKFATWLTRVAHNVAISRIRQHVRYRSRFAEEDEEFGVDTFDSPDPKPDEIAEAGDLHTRMIRHIDALPQHYRTALTLYYYEERTYVEIAEIMNKPMNTVKAYLHRAKAALEKALLAESPREEWIMEQGNE